MTAAAIQPCGALTAQSRRVWVPPKALRARPAGTVPLGTLSLRGGWPDHSESSPLAKRREGPGLQTRGLS